MKLVPIENYSSRLITKMYFWCDKTFGPGGIDKDWSMTEGKPSFVFWEDSHYELFLLRWLGQDD